MIKVGIIDYDCGNLFSISHALKHIGAEPYFCKTPDEIIQADRLLLPGVGAFGDAISTIHQRGLDAAIGEVAKAGRPIMGICLGMQLLVNKSEESVGHVGLGLIPGEIVRLPTYAREINACSKVPNVGWSRLNRPDDINWNGTVLKRNNEQDFTYFVHSYHLRYENIEFVLATQTFGDIESPSVIARDNVSGCQFHPERSNGAGLNILRSWIEI
jgi:glutamine amidotransferase